MIEPLREILSLLCPWMVELCQAPVNQTELLLLVVDHDLCQQQRVGKQHPPLLSLITEHKENWEIGLTLCGLTSRCMIPREWQ